MFLWYEWYANRSQKIKNCSLKHFFIIENNNNNNNNNNKDITIKTLLTNMQDVDLSIPRS